MSRSTPPLASQPRNETESAALDTGWSIPPAASPKRAEASPEGLATTAQSRLQRLSPRRRADGTLLGVAPPQAGAPAAPSARRPVVVHAGVARAEQVSTHADSERVEALPIPVAPPVVEALPIPVAPPVVEALPAPVVPTFVEALPAPVAPAVVEALPAPVAPTFVEASPLPLAPPVIEPLKALVAMDSGRRPARAEAVGVGEAMRTRVRFAGIDAPLWAIVTPITTALVIAFALGAAAGAWRFAAKRANVAGGHPPAVASAQPELAPAVQTSEPAAVETDLTRKPSASLTSAEVLMQASLASDKDHQAAKLFRERLLRDPASVKNKAVLAQLRKLTADPITAPEALAALAGLPGPESVDLLYEIWTGTPNRTTTTELARGLAYSRDVRAKASESLSVALDLRAAEECSANLALLPRAAQVGDRRSLQLLSKLTRKQGCGPKKQTDCFACLREGTANANELEAAITAVKARRAPTPFSP